MILKQSVHASSSRKFLGECVLLLFILDSRAFGNIGLINIAKVLFEKAFLNLNIISAFLVTFYVGKNS